MRNFSVRRFRAIYWFAVIPLATMSGTGVLAAEEDPRDAAFVKPLLNEALESEPSGKDIPWSNTATGRIGTIRIERTYFRDQQPCRDYMRTVVESGISREIRGTGCRTGRKRWDVEESRSEPATAKPAAMADPDTARSGDEGARSGDPTAGGDAPPPRPPRKPPVLQFSLPTKSQL